MAADSTSVETLLKRVEHENRISDENKTKAKNMLLVVGAMESQSQIVDNEAYGKTGNEERLKLQKRDFLTGLCEHIKQFIEFGTIPGKKTIDDYKLTVITRLKRDYPSVTLDEVLERKGIPFFKSRTANLLQDLIDAAPDEDERIVNSASQNRK
jgi:hypothetical protein